MPRWQPSQVGAEVRWQVGARAWRWIRTLWLRSPLGRWADWLRWLFPQRESPCLRLSVKCLL